LELHVSFFLSSCNCCMLAVRISRPEHSIAATKHELRPSQRW
jgi:hypothetical protein